MEHASKDSKEPAWRTAVTELVGVIWEHGDVAEMEVHCVSLLFFDARYGAGPRSLLSAYASLCLC